MHDLNDLLFFARAVEHGGFAPAARALGVTKSKLSRRVAALEERLGVRLIQRSTRRFQVTPIGQEFHRHCVAMLVEAEAAVETIERSRAEPQGVVRLSSPAALLQFQLGAMLSRFLAAHPRVVLHLESTSRRVDLIGEGIDVAVRVRFPPIEPSDLVMRTLGESTQRLVASPGLLGGAAGVATPADLSGLPSLDLGPPNRDHAWALSGPGGASATIRHEPRLVTDDMAVLHCAALDGVGVAQLPSMMIRQDLAEGRLVDLLPAWAPRSGIVHAVFPSRRGLLPSVRALIDFLAAEYAADARRGEGK